MATTSPDANDLYAGLTLPTRTKAPAAAASAPNRREHEDAKRDEKRKLEEPQDADDNAKRLKRADAPLEVQQTITRLKGYMLVDKKFAKASKLFGQLVREHMTTENHQCFIDALKDMIQHKGSTWSGKKEFEALIAEIVAKADALPANEDISRLLDDWKFMGITHAQLFTDETYQFVKAAKVVKARLDALPKAAATTEEKSKEGTQQQDYEIEIVMPLLRTMFSKHTTAWAKTMVETVLVVATQKRMLFPETHRKEIDSWTKTIQDRRSAPAAARSAGSDARRNILDASSSEATIRVGRFNHPLFNKEF
uniref:Uncharacterized protein n=1 Tax=Globisporangium ultimum (strain ATCC 200006 / CBS 805.95 / DAOM BR144) TaxID=431595 RepID=K3WJB0_GLOUD